MSDPLVTLLVKNIYANSRLDLLNITGRAYKCGICQLLVFLFQIHCKENINLTQKMVGISIREKRYVNA